MFANKKRLEVPPRINTQGIFHDTILNHHLIAVTMVACKKWYEANDFVM